MGIPDFRSADGLYSHIAKAGISGISEPQEVRRKDAHVAGKGRKGKVVLMDCRCLLVEIMLLSSLVVLLIPDPLFYDPF